MSITFSSELALPVQIDWSNPDTDGLLTCQFDDGTTITNLLTGVTGETFNVANIVGVADGSTRISATWTSKPAGIDLDPFSLCQTAQDKRDYYGLVFDSSSHRLSFPITIDNVDGEIIIGMSTNDVANNIVINLNSATSTRIEIGANGSVNFHNDAGSHWGFGGGHTATVVNEHFYIKIARISGTISISKSLDGVNWSLIQARSGLGFLIGDFDQISSTNNLTLMSLSLKGPIVDDVNKYWDFNKITGSTVTDKLNATVATLVNMDDTNWQRIIPKQTYTVGTAKDYPTVHSFEAASVNIDAYKVGEVFGDTGESATVSCVDQKGVFEVRAALGQEADFKGGGAKVGTATFSLARGVNVLRGLQLHSVMNTGVSSSINDDLIERCHIDNQGAAVGLWLSATNKITVKNILVSNCDRGAASASQTVNTEIINSAFVDNGDINLLRVKSTNVVAKGATSVDFYSTNEGDFNVSSDGTATGANSQNNVDFTGAFVDSDNGDYRINQAWADASLVGQGWNGSDIVAWSYHVVSNEGNEQSITVISAEQLTQSQLVNITGINNINAIVSEQLTHAQLSNILVENEISTVITEQKTQCTLSAIATVNTLTAVINEQLTHSIATGISDAQLITAVQAQQLTQALVIDVTSSGAQDVNVVISEQKTQSQAVSSTALQQLQVVICEQLTQAINVDVSQLLLTNAITAEQLTQAINVAIDESAGILVSVVETEQLTQLLKTDIDVAGLANAVINEQLTQYATQRINVNLNVSAVVAEQLTQSEIISVIQQNIAQQFNIDIGQIQLEILTPTYSIESLTPVFTIEHLH